MFEAVERQLIEHVVLHPVRNRAWTVTREGRLLGNTPLKRTQRAYILVGSPNMTFAALLAPATQCNIEAACILNERWEDARRLTSNYRVQGTLDQ